MTLLNCYDRARSDQQCSCDYADAADHDELLALETDPQVLGRLLGRVVTWPDCDYDQDGYLSPSDLLEFVRRHGWADRRHVEFVMMALQDASDAIQATER